MEHDLEVVNRSSGSPLHNRGPREESPSSKVIELRVIRGINLLPAAKGSARNPFCKVRGSAKKWLTTDVLRKTVNPHWNETFHLELDDKIELEVWDYTENRFSLANVYMGSIEISLAENEDKLVLKSESVQKFKLDETEVGDIELGITPLNFGVEPSDVSRMSRRFEKSDSFRRSLMSPEADILVESDDGSRIPTSRKAILGWLKVKMLELKPKIRPILLLIQEEDLMFTKLYYKGGMQLKGLQKEAESIAQPFTSLRSLPEVLFGVKEGWTFTLPGYTKETVKFAADTEILRDKWESFLAGKGAPAISRISGFLWKYHAAKKEIKYISVPKNNKKEQWRRWYCIADGNTFEWFSTGDIEAIQLKRIAEVERKVRSEHLKLSKICKSLHLQQMEKYSFEFILRDNKKELLATFVTRTLDQCNAWIGVLSVSFDDKENSGGRIRTSENGNGSPIMEDGNMGALTKLRRAYTMRLSQREERKRSITSATFDVSTSSPDVPSPFFSSVYVETPSTTKLRNKIREFVTKADEETGKTNYGNWSVDVRKPNDGHFRIISFDGGGFKTILQAVIMERLVEIFPDLLEHFDMFAGCSGGSVVATTLATGRSPVFLRDMLEVMDPLLVPKDSTRTSVAGFGVKKAKYSHDRMFLFGAEMFRDVTFRKMKRKLLITSFLLDNCEEDEHKRSWAYMTYHNIEQNYQHGQFLVDTTPKNARESNSSIAAGPEDRSEVLTLSPVGSPPKEELVEKKKKKGSGGRDKHSVEKDIDNATDKKPTPLLDIPVVQSEHGGEGDVPIKSPRRTRRTSMRRDKKEMIHSETKSPDVQTMPEEENTSGEPEKPRLTSPSHSKRGPANKKVQKVEEMLDLPVWEAILYSSSAPTFFPSYKRHVDGGVAANNPALAAVTEVMAITAKNPIPTAKLHVLSISCGTFRMYVEGDTHDWGILQWGPRLTDLLLRTGDAQTDMMCDKLLGENYHRLAPPIARKLPMDDPAIVPDLAKYGREVDLTETIKWIKKHIYNDENMHTIADDNREKREGIRPAIRSPLAPTLRDHYHDTSSSDEAGVDTSDEEVDEDDFESGENASQGATSRFTSLNLNWAKVWRAK